MASCRPEGHHINQHLPFEGEIDVKKLIVAAFAALAMIGCTPDKAEKAPSTAPTETVQATSQPAPQPIAPVTVTDINDCKNAWAAAWAKEHGTTVAAAERYARQISTTPPTTLRINGQDYVFGDRNKGATVWSTCEASLKAARLAPAQARSRVRDPAMAALNAALRAENQRLTAENRTLRSLAYQNPEETDPAKLIANQARVTELEMHLADAQRPITRTTIIIAALVGLACLVLGLYIGARRWRRRSR